MPGLLYLDASAIVKMIRAEPESPALAAAISTSLRQLTSVVGAIEVHRVAKRGDASAERVAAVLGRIDIVPLDDDIVETSATCGSANLKTLDAIHLASALTIAAELDAFLSYDRRLADDALASGLRVLAPA